MKKIWKYLLYHFTLWQLVFILTAIIFVTEVSGEIYFAVALPHKMHGKWLSFLLDQKHSQALSDVIMINKTEYLEAKAQNVFRIIILGGSAAYGFGDDIRKSWGHLLGERLQKELNKTGKKVEVINMAAGAYTSIDDYVNFMLIGVRLDPDLVIVYNGWNDIAAFSGNPGWIVRNTAARLDEIRTSLEGYDLRTKFRNKFFLGRKFFQVKRQMEELISILYARREAERSTIALLMKQYLGFPNETWTEIVPLPQESKLAGLSFDDLLAEQAIGADYIPVFQKFHQEIKKLFLFYYETNTKSLMRVLRDRHIPALFVFQPDLVFLGLELPLTSSEDQIGRRLFGSRTDKWKEIVKKLYPAGIQVMEKTATEYNIPFVDMTRVVTNYSGDVFFVDTAHYTEEGNRIVAATLYDVVLREKLVPAK